MRDTNHEDGGFLPPAASAASPSRFERLHESVRPRLSSDELLRLTRDD